MISRVVLVRFVAGCIPGASIPARMANAIFSSRRNSRLLHDDDACDDAEGRSAMR